MTLIQGREGFARAKTVLALAHHASRYLTTNVADVDLIDIKENNLSNSVVTIADPDEDDDASIFSITNDNTREDEKILAEKEDEKIVAEKEDDLLVVRTMCTATNESDAAEKCLLARKAVVRFVQDPIANAVDRQ